MRAGLDVMGGDFAPAATLEGALLALREMEEEDSLVLIGDSALIEANEDIRNLAGDRLTIIHAPDVIGMGDQPIRAFTSKPDSSLAMGFRLLKEGDIDAFSSAGNTGAMLVGAMYAVHTIPGIIRPCTLVLIPRLDGGHNLLVDVGTNPDAKPDVMYQFGLLGNIYARAVLGVEQPKVGLLNIGEEEEKGSLLCQSTFRLMKDSTDYHFIGNVESRDIFKDKVDVVVTDGFTGNIVIKHTEAFFRMMAKRGLMDDYFARFNYENYGGSPILGVNGSVVVGHGISNARAIKNMILLSVEIHKAGLTEKIRQAMSGYTGRTEQEQ